MPLSLQKEHSLQDLYRKADFAAIAERIGWRVGGDMPSREGRSDLEYAEHLLWCGVAESNLAGFKVSGAQSRAKDMLSRSARLFGDDNRAHVARAWLGWAYNWTGEFGEALTMAETVLAAPVTSRDRFGALLLKAVVYCRQGLIALALAAILEMQPFYDDVDDLMKGRFHNQRGRVLKLMGERDRAIIDYDSAAQFFERAANLQGEGIAANNLSSIFLDAGRFIEAHNYAERACSLFHRLGDKTYEAKAWDQTALIYLAENNLKSAERAAKHAVSLVQGSDQSSTLAECLITHGTILARLGFDDAQRKLTQAIELCEHVGDTHQSKIAYSALTEMVRRGKDMARGILDCVKPVEVAAIRRAMELHHGKVSVACEDLGMSASGLKKRLEALKSQGIDIERSKIYKRPHRSIVRTPGANGKNSIPKI